MQVSFLYAGSPGIVARRALTGEVLDQRARRDGGTDFLVKSSSLPSSKWINAEFCRVAPSPVAEKEKATTVATASAVA